MSSYFNVSRLDGCEVELFGAWGCATGTLRFCGFIVFGLEVLQIGLRGLGSGVGVFVVE